MRSRIARAAAFVALIAIAAFVPARHALAQYMGGDGLGGGSEQALGTLNTLYCQLTGCTITGAIQPNADNATNLGASGKNYATVFANAITSSNSTVTITANGGASNVILGSPLNVNSHAVSGVTTLTLAQNLLSGTSTTTNAGTGSCSSVTVSGTVLDFTIQATCTAAQTVVVTFSTGFGAAPICTLSSANTAAGGVTTGTPYQSAGGSTTATFTFPAVTAGKYNAHCML